MRSIATVVGRQPPASRISYRTELPSPDARGDYVL
jgi:hypothetical protein